MAENNPIPELNAAEIWAEVEASLANLSTEVPKQPNISILQKRIEYDEEIDGVNAKAESAMVDSRAKLVNLYIACEQQRLSQQEPLLKLVISLNKTLIWLFNIVIGVVTLAVLALCFIRSDTNILDSLFDFLKYYIGAVVVELIGMLFFIVRGVFSSNFNKIMENVLNPDSKKKKE